MDVRQSAITSHLALATTLFSPVSAATSIRPPETIEITAYQDEGDLEEIIVESTIGDDRGMPAAQLDAMAAQAIEELRGYLEFTAGWDGYDGLPFGASTILRAESLVERLRQRFAFTGTNPTEITPGPISDGRVDVEVATETRHLVLTVDPDEEAILIAHEERGGDEGVAQSDERGVERWMDWLAGTSSLPTLVRETAINPIVGDALALNL